MWWGFLDHGDPGSARYSGGPVAIVTRYGALIGLFLASGCFASVRFEHGGGAAAWILRTLVVPSLYLGDPDGAKSVCILGTLAVLSVYHLAAGAITLSESFSSLWQLAIRGPLTGPYLLLGASGA